MTREGEEYTRHPFYGSRKMVIFLETVGHIVNRKRVQRLMQQMGLAGMAPGPNTSRPHPEHKIYPYLLRAGLGAGFGGAFVMAMQVAATAWGPSGLLALFVMTAGPHGVAASVGCYAVGLVICYIMGFIVTNAMVSVEDVANA